jgi:hypothetical protein
MVHPTCPQRQGANADFLRRAYVPDGLDFDFMTAKWRDHGRYLVGRVYLEHHVRPEADRDDWVPLNAELMQKLVSKRYYRRILDELIDGRVMEQRADYKYRAKTAASPGHSSSFRITPLWRYRRFHSVWLTDKNLVGKLRRRDEEDEKELTAPVHRHLRAMFGRLRVEEDSPKVSLPLTTIADQQWQFKVCEYGRCHTNLTRLRRTLRTHLRVNDQPLWQVDVKNSQPFILGLVLRDAGRLERDADFNEYRAKLVQSKSQKSTETHQKASVPYVGTGDYQNDARLTKELDAYLDLCRSGQVYEHFMTVMGLPLTREARDQFKPTFFLPVYGQLRLAHTPVGRAFQSGFPAMWDAICRIKVGNHARLACLMQTVESWLVVWRACDRIRREHPTAPVFTIHDSICTTGENIERFRDILVEEFVRAFGMAPSCDVKAFAKEAA